MELVECVPNVSEGRNREVIERILDEVRKVDGVRLLDCRSDASHNRSVVTFIGSPQAAKEAAFALASKAVELINLETHKGEHPRVGACDVIPFVPLSGVTMKDCVALARELGKDIADRLRVPVYFYEEAAMRPERKDLSHIRKGEFESLKTEITKPERAPDVGEARVHPTAGATVVGARPPLIAYNVNLGTDNLEIAKKIAKRLRAKDGGLSRVKALGMKIEERNMAQVSMNLTDFRKSSMYAAREMVRMEAARYGVSVIGTEIVGLVPLDALLECASYYLQLEDFKRDQILDLHIS
ncbi:MAG: glutamate formimidoyltransferase [Armatimonadetes bacterium]|nr:glutamate formimidoyltransferase [Armatimonadota bacterium]